MISPKNDDQKSARKKIEFRAHSRTHLDEWVQWVTQLTHTHRFLRTMLLTLLILTGFHRPCYSRYSYSRVFMGHAYSRTHTHGVLSKALLILTHTHSNFVSFLTLMNILLVLQIMAEEDEIWEELPKIALRKCFYRLFNPYLGKMTFFCH